MPPHLHPRSRVTTSLFTTTLLASFVIVGVPHIFPCPVPRTDLADSSISIDADGRPMKPRRRKKSEARGNAGDGGCSGAATEESETVRSVISIDEEAKIIGEKARECPVPKPSGLLGELLGLVNNRDGSTGETQEHSKGGIRKPMSSKGRDESLR